jgi:hypothetical protein
MVIKNNIKACCGMFFDVEKHFKDLPAIIWR